MAMVGAGSSPFTSSESRCVPSTSIAGGGWDASSGEVSSTQGSADRPVDDGNTIDDSVCDDDNDELCGLCIDDTLPVRPLCPRSGTCIDANGISELRRSFTLRSSTAARISA
jgi:hypothetical protein